MMFILNNIVINRIFKYIFNIVETYTIYNCFPAYIFFPVALLISDI